MPPDIPIFLETIEWFDKNGEGLVSIFRRKACPRQMSQEFLGEDLTAGG